MSILVTNLIKNFGEPPTNVLKGLNFEIADGEFVAITGKSGSGKSTLLYILSTLDMPSGGQVALDGNVTDKMTDMKLHEFRNQKMGFIFQFHYLLPELTALENVLMPTIKLKQQEMKRSFAMELLHQFDLDGKGERYPSQLSGGEQQRVAIARALIMSPRYVFADEPTGNLDSVNGDKVMEILKSINLDQKTSVIMVTHDPDYANLATRRIHLIDGCVSEGPS